MIAVIQRVNRACVVADGVKSGEISKGLYILLGVEKDDDETDCLLLADKISKIRIFTDQNDKMNLSVNDVWGSVLVVSNFTLNANYAHGNRPDYLASAAPDRANDLYEHFKLLMSSRVSKCECGVFGADMKVSLCNDGPVTFSMDSRVLKRER